MAVTHFDFLAIAERLEESDTEIDSRNAISRSYYAAYHQCVLIQNTFDIESHPSSTQGGMHRQLCMLLAAIDYHPTKNQHISENLKQDLKLIGQELLRLLSSRTEADYHLSRDITSSDALVHIEKVKTLLDRCSSLVVAHEGD